MPSSTPSSSSSLTLLLAAGSGAALVLSMLLIRPTILLNFAVGGTAKRGAHSVAWITAPDQESAAKLAKGIVNKRLAACVNVVPAIRSFYFWEGRVEDDEEVLLMVKTRTALRQELTEFVVENHPYDLPEVITADITGGHERYLKWIDEETKAPEA